MRQSRQSPTIFAFVAALVILIAVACGSGSASTPVPEGALSGVVTIGPLCPVEPCTDPPNPYIDLEVIADQVGSDFVTAIPVQPDGSYSGTLPVGQYKARVEPCIYLGCRFGQEFEVVVEERRTTVLNIDIDTGIR